MGDQRRRPAHEPGEVLALVWSETPEFWAVYGHVDAANAVEWARESCEIDGDEPPSRFDTTRLHRYARWSFYAPDDADSSTLTLRLYDEPARGRFKVTVVYDGDEIDRCATSKADRRAAKERTHAAVLAKYPEATNIRPYEGTKGWAAEFDVPGCKAVHWSLAETHVIVRITDMAAWNTYTATRTSAARTATPGALP